MTKDHLVAAHAVLAYIYNTSGVKFVSDIFGTEVHPGYADEKADAWGHSPVRAISYLDERNFRRLVEKALEKYGEDGMRRASYPVAP